MAIHAYWIPTRIAVDERTVAKVNPSYVSRVVRLAYLSPAIVEAILDGQFPTHLTMKDLMEPFPMDWAQQQEHFFGEP